MCGVIGFCVHHDATSEAPSAQQLEGAMDLIKHRGPDERGNWATGDGKMGIAMVRLSIIDLSGGHQPLSSQGVYAVVNGELYDFERIRGELENEGYVFKTKSDSEIALHLYIKYGAPHFLKHLRGEFAVIIVDTRGDRPKMFVARDRLGLKPLFYTTTPEGVTLVASEIKAFKSMGWRAQWDVKSLVENGWAVDERTPYLGVYKLRPGHCMWIEETSRPKVERYWDVQFPNRDHIETRSVDEMIETVRDIIVETVKLRLRADVKTAIYLSGGIDSSAIAGIAQSELRKLDPNARVKAFSLSFPGHGESDEGPIAQRTAQFCGADMQVVPVSEVDLIEAFPEMVYHTEYPSVDLSGSGKFLLSKATREAGYIVTLTGEGSDEFFGGYHFFLQDYFRYVDPNIEKIFGNQLTEEKRQARLAEDLKKKVSHTYAASKVVDMNAFSEERREIGGISLPLEFGGFGYAQALFLSEAKEGTKVVEDNSIQTHIDLIDEEVKEKMRNVWHPLHSSQYIQKEGIFSNILLNHLGDRVEMAHSVEGRVPFCDHLLIEYVASLPPCVKVKYEEESINEKWILKEAVKPFITEEMYLRKKMPYHAPVNTQAQQEGPNALTKMFDRYLTRERVEKLGFIRYEMVEKVKKAFAEETTVGFGGYTWNSRTLFAVVSLVILGESFQVQKWSI